MPMEKYVSGCRKAIQVSINYENMMMYSHSIFYLDQNSSHDLPVNCIQSLSFWFLQNMNK